LHQIHFDPGFSCLSSGVGVRQCLWIGEVLRDFWVEGAELAVSVVASAVLKQEIIQNLQFQKTYREEITGI
jgi:hypothetical protein